jgi:hypothetical protein
MRSLEGIHSGITQGLLAVDLLRQARRSVICCLHAVGQRVRSLGPRREVKVASLAAR